MKVKHLAAAVAALGCASAFAAPLSPNTTTPSVTFYVAGASAQKAAIYAVAPSLFAVPADVVEVNNGASKGWLGMSAAALTGTSVPLLVIYNSTNGSASGVNQLLTSPATAAPSYVDAATGINLGNDSKNMALPDATCGALVARTPSAADPAGWTTTCTGALAALHPDMALSDVQPSEFGAGVVQTGAGFFPVSATAVSKTALEGFGVIVNKNLYSALQNQNVADGLLPATCAVAYPGIVTGGACQPSIRSRDYGVIAQFNGAFAGAEAQALVPNVAVPAAAAGSSQVTLCRRDAWSGSQAASNMYFLNNACGGAASLTAASDYAADPTSFQAQTPTLQVVAKANTGTGVTEACTKNAAVLGMGVVSLQEQDEADVGYTGAKGYYFVKLDNVSPNFVNGAVEALHRTPIMNGNYQFAVDMSAVTLNTISGSKANIANGLIAAIKNSTLHNLTGIAYTDQPLNWGVDGKNAKYDRQGNNCSPLR